MLHEIHEAILHCVGKCLMVYLQSHDQVICGNLSRDVRVPDGRQPEERALHRQVHRLLPVPVRAQRGLGMILIFNYN